MLALAAIVLRCILVSTSVPTSALDADGLPNEPTALVELLAISQERAGNFPTYTVPEPVPRTGQPDEPEPEKRDYRRDPRFIAQRAADKLEKMGTRVFPELLKHLYDERQSIALASVIPCSLRLACYHLIANQVNVDLSLQYLRYRILDGRVDLLPVWWQERKGQTLPELKEEALSFAFALAAFDRNEKAVATIRQLALEAGVNDLEVRSQGISGMLRTLTLPENDEALVDSLQEEDRGSFLSRRINDARASRSFELLSGRGAPAYPVLTRNLNRPEVSDMCLRILRNAVEDWVVEGYTFSSRFSLLTPENAGRWFDERKGKSLREMQRDIAQYHLEAATRENFTDAEEKEDLIRRLKKRIMELTE